SQRPWIAQPPARETRQVARSPFQRAHRTGRRRSGAPGPAAGRIGRRCWASLAQKLLGATWTVLLLELPDDVRVRIGSQELHGGIRDRDAALPLLRPAGGCAFWQREVQNGVARVEAQALADLLVLVLDLLVLAFLALEQ